MNVKINDEIVGTALNVKKQDTAQKMLSIALDGTPYAQTTGSPIIRYIVDCYCGTATNRNKLDNASNQGALVTVSTRNDLEVTGYIEENTIDWKEWPDGHGVGKFTLVQGD